MVLEEDPAEASATLGGSALKDYSERHREVMDIDCTALRPVPANLDEVLQTQKEELGSQTVVPAVADSALAARPK